ncbi:hypothetical protein Hanom_Chr17g01576261 [Helianthus anomalus]
MITLFADFFYDGNFQFPITKFFAKTLSYYRFHISQLSSLGMVRIKLLNYIVGPKALNQMCRSF